LRDHLPLAAAALLRDRDEVPGRLRARRLPDAVRPDRRHRDVSAQPGLDREPPTRDARAGLARHARLGLRSGGGPALAVVLRAGRRAAAPAGRGGRAPLLPRLARVPDGDVRGDARRPRRAERRVRRALAALAAVVILAGCGDSQKSNAPAQPAPPTPSTAPAPAPTPAPEPPLPAAPAVPSGNLRGDAANGARLYAQYVASCPGA